MNKNNKLLIFNVDNLLLDHEKNIIPHMRYKLAQLKEMGYDFAVISEKSHEKIRKHLKNNYNLFEYIFSDNGTTIYCDNSCIHNTSLKKNYTEKQIQNIINILLQLVVELIIPYKRGNFVSFNNSFIRYIPIGSDCDDVEHKAFMKYDVENNVRVRIIDELKKYIPNDFNLEYEIGDKNDIIIHPNGWNPIYCLQYVINNYDEIIYYNHKNIITPYDKVKIIVIKNNDDMLQKLEHLVSNLN